MTEVRTTCPYCGVGCGIIASPDGTIKGDPDHPANYGRLCSKGSSLGETIGLEGRLLKPQISGVESDWDTALSLVADKFGAAIRDHGPDSVAFYVSGQLLTEDYYVANKLMKGYIGSANIDTNSRLCMASSVAGHKRAFGTDTVPAQYEDLEQADLVVLVGSNLAWCHPVLFQRLVAAKKQRPNMKVVVIDPRRTATAEIADLMLQVRPDGDTDLFNILLAEIAKRGLVDLAYVKEHVSGAEEAISNATTAKPAGTGLNIEDLNAFLDLWCKTEKVVTVYSQGVNQSVGGTDKVNAILNCHLATGRIGRPGTGPFSVTGQPNAMGGREVGGLANMLACHLDIENPDHRSKVQTFWNAPTISENPGLRAVDMFDACANGEIKALWIMSTNPAVSMPNADRVRDAIKSVPFTVVSDILVDTDTTRLADVLLPAKAWGEKSGTVTNSERRISRQRAFLAAPGETRADWDIIAEVGRRMGWEAAFPYADEAEIFREYADMSALSRDSGKDFDITGLSGLDRQNYDAMQPVVWPISDRGKTKRRFFSEGGFYHPDGKAKMLPVSAPMDDGAQLRLNTGRVRDHWHTMTRTGRAPRLGSHLAEPYLEIHPKDAQLRGLKDADLCEVSSANGKAILRAMISDKVAVGNPFAPMHWTEVTSQSGRVNALVAPVTDPVSSQPASKGSPVEVQKYQAAWYGFVASASEISPSCEYSAIARTSTGWRAEFASTEPAKVTDDFVRKLTGIYDGDVIYSEDSKSGAARMGIWREGVLSAVLFVAREPVEVARSFVVDQIGTDAAPMRVLAGIPGKGQVDKGTIVCSCLSVGANQIRSALENGAKSTEDLGKCLGAGTNCGSCLPELKAMLRSNEQSLLAAE